MRIDFFAVHYQDSVFQETCLLQGCEFTVAMRSVKYLAIYEIQILSAIVDIKATLLRSRTNNGSVLILLLGRTLLYLLSIWLVLHSSFSCYSRVVINHGISCGGLSSHLM